MQHYFMVLNDEIIEIIISTNGKFFIVMNKFATVEKKGINNQPTKTEWIYKSTIFLQQALRIIIK